MYKINPVSNKFKKYLDFSHSKNPLKYTLIFCSELLSDIGITAIDLIETLSTLDSTRIRKIEGGLLQIFKKMSVFLYNNNLNLGKKSNRNKRQIVFFEFLLTKTLFKIFILNINFYNFVH